MELRPKSATNATAATTEGQCFVLSSVMFIILRPPPGRGLITTTPSHSSSVRSHYPIRCGGAEKRCLITKRYKLLFAASWDFLAEDQGADVFDRGRAIGKCLVVVTAQSEFVVPGGFDSLAHFDVLLVADEVSR